MNTNVRYSWWDIDTGEYTGKYFPTLEDAQQAVDTAYAEERVDDDGIDNNGLCVIPIGGDETQAIRPNVPKARTVIVSRHAGAIEWLRRHGIEGDVIAQATPEDVQEAIVIGNLPLHLAALTARIGSIDLPNLAAADRGRDLSPEEMDAAGACLHWYSVHPLG